MSSSPELAAVEIRSSTRNRRSLKLQATSSGRKPRQPQKGPPAEKRRNNWKRNWPQPMPKEFAKDCSRPSNLFEKQLTERTREELPRRLRAFAQKTNEYYSRAEVELVHLALAIAAKILHREAQVDRMLVAALVKVAMEKLQHGTTATVRVRPEEVADWNRYFEGNASRRDSGGGEGRSCGRSAQLHSGNGTWGPQSLDWTHS